MTEAFEPRILLKVEQIVKQPLRVTEIILAVVWLYGTSFLRKPIGFDNWVGRFGDRTQSLLGALYFGVAFAALLVVLYLMRRRRAGRSNQLADVEESADSPDRAV